MGSRGGSFLVIFYLKLILKILVTIENTSLQSLGSAIRLNMKKITTKLILKILLKILQLENDL